jgi:hypothetical protein
VADFVSESLRLCRITVANLRFERLVMCRRAVVDLRFERLVMRGISQAGFMFLRIYDCVGEQWQI